MKYFLALILMSAAIVSTKAEQPVWVLGYNHTTCGFWTKERRANSSSATVVHAWIVGFLSGVGMTGNPNLLFGIDNDAVDGWIDNYCSAHPLETMGEVAVALVGDLKSRAKNSN
jgi:hypothetical protein